MVYVEDYTFIVKKMVYPPMFFCHVLEFPQLVAMEGESAGEAIEAMQNVLRDAPQEALSKNPPYDYNAAMDRIFHHRG